MIRPFSVEAAEAKGLRILLVINIIFIGSVLVFAPTPSEVCPPPLELSVAQSKDAPAPLEYCLFERSAHSQQTPMGFCRATQQEAEVILKDLRSAEEREHQQCMQNLPVTFKRGIYALSQNVNQFMAFAQAHE